MTRLRRQWASLSFEAKLGIVVMPIVLALLTGLVVPWIADRLSPETKAERGGVVKIIDLQSDVPLSDFAAQQAAAPLRVDDYVLAAAQEPETTPETSPEVTPEVTPETTPEVTPGVAPELTPEVGTSAAAGDADGDGVPDASDLCPTTAGNRPNGCRAVYLQTEGYGCSEEAMAEAVGPGEGGSTRCEDLSGVVGETTGDDPGLVQQKADAVAAALHETRTIDVGGRLEPLGVVVTIQATVTGLEGEEAELTWSLRHADGRRLPHQWLRKRAILTITGEAERDTGSAEFWVPLPKRPRGPYFVRVAMSDDKGTPLTFAKSSKVG